MSFELEGVNQFSAEVEQGSAVQPQQPPANPIAEELNDTELHAIAGGVFGVYQYNSNIPRSRGLFSQQ